MWLKNTICKDSDHNGGTGICTIPLESVGIAEQWRFLLKKNQQFRSLIILASSLKKALIPSENIRVSERTQLDYSHKLLGFK